MASTIRMKRSSVATKVPTTAQLDLGELAINTRDGKLFLKCADGTEQIVEVGARWELLRLRSQVAHFCSNTTAQPSCRLMARAISRCWATSQPMGALDHGASIHGVNLAQPSGS